MTVSDLASLNEVESGSMTANMLDVFIATLVSYQSSIRQAELTYFFPTSFAEKLLFSNGRHYTIHPDPGEPNMPFNGRMFALFLRGYHFEDLRQEFICPMVCRILYSSPGFMIRLSVTAMPP